MSNIIEKKFFKMYLFFSQLIQNCLLNIYYMRGIMLATKDTATEKRACCFEFSCYQYTYSQRTSTVKIYTSYFREENTDLGLCYRDEAIYHLSTFLLFITNKFGDDLSYITTKTSSFPNIKIKKQKIYANTRDQNHRSPQLTQQLANYGPTNWSHLFYSFIGIGPHQFAYIYVLSMFICRVEQQRESIWSTHLKYLLCGPVRKYCQPLV